MTEWLVSTLAGLGLGTAFFYCVRLRVNFGPLARERFGAWARVIVWNAIFASMILMANLALYALRAFLAGAGTPSVWHEFWFALVALASGVTMVLRRAHRK